MQTWKKRCALLFALLFSITPLSACGGEVEDESSSLSSSEESVEETRLPKTELRVSFINAGFGDGWTVELEKGFEEKVKNVSFEPGKRGVDVVFEVGTYDMTAMQVASSEQAIHFMENPNDVRQLMQAGVLEPLDALMNAPNPDDNGQKIGDKVDAQHKQAYSYGGKQYLLPHYMGAYGIVYNRDMFDERGFYFAATPDAETGNLFVDETRTEKSVGPDGKANTDDDGLPTTYEEFFLLCDEINANGIDPVGFTGQYSAWHLGYLMDALAINNEGVEQGRLNYTFDGEAKALVVLEEDGSVKRENGKLVTESKTIAPENGYDTARLLGQYYAMDFVAELFGDTTYYNEEDGNPENKVTYLDMQQRFLENATQNKKEIAMIVDGTWWQREADGVFERMAKRDEKYAKENRRFGWLPLPQATKEDADKIKNGERKTVFGDQINAVVCMKAGLTDAKKQVAQAFLTYVYTDEALTNFTYTVGATVAVDYLDALDDAKLTPYEKSYVGYLKRSDIVYPVSSEPRFAERRNAYRAHTKYNSPVYTDITTAFMFDRISTDDYFADYQFNFKGIAWG